MLRKLVMASVLLVVAAMSGSWGQQGESVPAQARRQALLRQSAQGPLALSALTAALQDENLLIRRTAVRLLAQLGPTAHEALVDALDNSDPLVRRAALLTLGDPPRAERLPELTRGCHDDEVSVRLAAVSLVAQIKPRTQAMYDLLDQLQRDEALAVREVASAAVWPFFKETISIRDRKDWDHEIIVAQSIPLPLSGWKFKTDPEVNGHLHKWYEAEFDDSSWGDIEIGEPWENQGYDYDGTAWYRGRFELPEQPARFVAVELAFGGVDEIAWVWVNGEYVGQHDLGTEGWDIPFTLEVTDELNWGGENQITVRVHDSAYAGGIWKPVTVQVLQ